MPRAGSKRKANPKNATKNATAEVEGKKVEALPPSIAKTEESNIVKEELECAVCTNLYTDPRILNCMHSFCSGCIEQIQNHADQKNVPCPKCQFVTKVGEDGSLHLLRNHVLEQKLKQYQASLKKEKPYQCSDCAAEKATGMCSTCKLKLCDFCGSYHKRSLKFKDHEILSMDELSNEDLIEKQPIQCPLHKQELKCYCQTCKITICVDCMLSMLHQTHVFLPVAEVMQREVESLKISIEEASTEFGEYESYLEKAEQFHAKSVVDNDSSIKVVNDTIAEFHQIVEAVKQQLLEWLDIGSRSSADAMKDVKAQLNHVKNLTSHLEETLEYPAAEIFDVINGASHLKDKIQRIKLVNKVRAAVSSDIMYDFPARLTKIAQHRNFDLQLFSRKIERVGLSDHIVKMVQSQFALKESRFGEEVVNCFWELKNVSKVKGSLLGPQVTHGKLLWRIQVIQQSTVIAGAHNRGLGVYVQCQSQEEDPLWICKAHCTLTLKNHTGNDFSQQFLHKFSKSAIDQGFPCFLPWKDIMDNNHGFIKDDTITITALIRIAYNRID